MRHAASITTTPLLLQRVRLRKLYACNPALRGLVSVNTLLTIACMRIGQGSLLPIVRCMFFYIYIFGLPETPVRLNINSFYEANLFIYLHIL